MHDLVIRGGLVVDGTGLPGRTADVAVSDGRVTAVGRVDGEARQVIDADGLVVAPGIVDIHTHYDPQLTWDPLCDTSALHGVTTVAAGNCGFSIAPCRADDHAYVAQMFARVEGMDPAALDRIPWGFETFGEYLDTRSGRLGLNLGMYVGHSALRRWVMGDAAFERASTPDELDAISTLFARAMADGSLGLSSSHAPTHLDMADRPVPSRLASLDEMRALADVQGRTGVGSIAYAPGSAVEGIDAADRDLLIELAGRAGVPVVTQGLGGRSKVDAPTKAWAASSAFLDRSAAAGAPVYSLLMARPLNGPFSLARGTSRYEGVPLWDALLAEPHDEKVRLLRDPEHRARLRDAIDHPNRDASVGSTLPPPIWESLRVARVHSDANRAAEGRTVGALAGEDGRHPADVVFDLALADDLETVFHWSNETPAWRELLRDVQRHPQMVVGVSDGGAHLGWDDGAEWSTYFLTTWWQGEQLWRLEEAIRLMTSVPAGVVGLRDRGVLAVGRPADVFLFDPERLAVGRCGLAVDERTGLERFRSVPEGIRATIVNGTVVVDDGTPTGATPGQVVRPC
ncbi:amidohydrolase family protein [Iamia majanohamensis]|uniref:Amidohydrolase family protein n=1 Tax=Iamia majanohamensis TaxID=467976 RepID=A0AAF0BV83_9ACTN|nr:amidohydrolase family protein [Iamia majanohamensis]WCO66114.1 amidohydrolase family protein [Iamia majanohamensis]